jgi:hypothetical protein
MTADRHRCAPGPHCPPRARTRACPSQPYAALFRRLRFLESPPGLRFSERHLYRHFDPQTWQASSGRSSPEESKVTKLPDGRQLGSYNALNLAKSKIANALIEHRDTLY